MIRSVYEAAAAMMAQMARQLMISDNLSNATTPGYKQETGNIDDFQQMLLNRIAGSDISPIGDLSTAVRLDNPGTDLSQGSLVETGNPLDLAIAGNALFAIQTPDGVQYTRDGTFHLDPNRQLVTSDGLPVLGVNGPLTLPQGTVRVETDGTVRVDNTIVGQLQLVEFPSDAAIQRVGNNRFAIDGQGTRSQTAGVSQGFLEQSNVDVTQAMVDMLAAARSYALAQRVLQLSDSSLQLAVNDLGRVG